jgi:hypothetical protein
MYLEGPTVELSQPVVDGIISDLRISQLTGSGDACILVSVMHIDFYLYSEDLLELPRTDGESHIVELHYFWHHIDCLEIESLDMLLRNEPIHTLCPSIN